MNHWEEISLQNAHVEQDASKSNYRRFELEDQLARQIELLEAKKQNLIKQQQAECLHLENFLVQEYQALERKLLEKQERKREELNCEKEEVRLQPSALKICKSNDTCTLISLIYFITIDLSRPTKLCKILVLHAVAAFHLQ